MTQAEDIAKLQADVASLREQIVTLRLQLDQQAHATAALIDHAVSKAIDAKMGGRALTEAQWDWVRDGESAAADRKKARSAIVLHVIQWGVGGTVGFMLWSAWEAIKAKVKQP